MSWARRVLLAGMVLVACRPVPGGSDPADAAGGVARIQPSAPESPGDRDDADDEPPLRLVEVAPGVHAALQPAARRFIDANAALVVTDAGVVVIDAPQNSAAARWLATTADAMSEAPRRGLVTTHWHLDHALGATFVRAVFDERRREVEHWGHAGLDALLSSGGVEQLDERRSMLTASIERGRAMVEQGRASDGTIPTDEQREQLSAQLAAVEAEAEVLSDVALLHPTHHAAKPTTITLGDTTLELIPLTAHTDADLVVHLPGTGVLITGDVLDEIPYAGHGRPRRWLAALDRLDALGATTIIPGHGPVMGPEHLARARTLWSAVLGQAMLGVQRGEDSSARHAQWQTTPEYQQLRDVLVTDGASERNFDAMVPVALDRAMADIRGDLDPPAGRGP